MKVAVNAYCFTEEHIIRSGDQSKFRTYQLVGQTQKDLKTQGKKNTKQSQEGINRRFAFEVFGFSPWVARLLDLEDS